MTERAGESFQRGTALKRRGILAAAGGTDGTPLILGAKESTGSANVATESAKPFNNAAAMIG